MTEVDASTMWPRSHGRHGDGAHQPYAGPRTQQAGELPLTEHAPRVSERASCGGSGNVLSERPSSRA
eukprot:scaffold4795_cov126-Isochrysis_galbana.AAC.4